MEQQTATTLAKVYAILDYISAVFLLIVGVVILAGGSALTWLSTTRMMPFEPQMAGPIVGSVAAIIGILIILIGCVYIAIGRAVWQGTEWGRVAQIVLSVLGLLSFPIGTIIGTFGIWFFGFSPEGKAHFGTAHVVRKKK